MTICRRFIAVAMLCAGNIGIYACEETLQERMHELLVQFQQENERTSKSPFVRYAYAPDFDQNLYEALVAALPRYKRDAEIATAAFVRNPQPACAFVAKLSDLVIELCDFLEQRIAVGVPMTTVAQLMEDPEGKVLVERTRAVWADAGQALLSWYGDIGLSTECIAESHQGFEIMGRYVDSMCALIPTDASCPVYPEQMLVMLQQCKIAAVQFKKYGVMSIESLARVLATEAGKKRVARLIESCGDLYADVEVGKKYFVLRNVAQEKTVNAEMIELVQHDVVLDAVDALMSLSIFLTARMAPDFLPSDVSIETMHQ